MGVSAEEINLVPIVFFIPAEGADPGHFRIGQREIIQFGIFLNAAGTAGAGDDRRTLLRIPPEDHLGGGLPVGLRDSGDRLATQQVRRMPPALPGDTSPAPQYPGSGYRE